jgi:hypothetical protein
MAVIAVLAFALAIMGCANPQEKERAGGSGGEKAARPAQEAKTSRKDAAGAPSPPSAEIALSILEGLAVGPSGSMAGYSRDEFPHWASEAERYGWKEPDGSCDVRDLALIRDGKGVEIDGECSITAGTGSQ